MTRCLLKRFWWVNYPSQGYVFVSSKFASNRQEKRTLTGNMTVKSTTYWETLQKKSTNEVFILHYKTAVAIETTRHLLMCLWNDFLCLFKTTYQAMGGYRVLALLVFQGVMNVCYLAVAEDATSSCSAYFTTQEKKRLEGHVVEQFNSPSSISCSYSCQKNPWCTSTNFKLLSEKNGEGTCELNRHGVLAENAEFREQQGVTFSLILKVRHC